MIFPGELRMWAKAFIEKEGVHDYKNPPKDVRDGFRRRSYKSSKKIAEPMQIWQQPGVREAYLTLEITDLYV